MDSNRIPRVLLFDDDPTIPTFLEIERKHSGAQVTFEHAVDVEEAINQLNEKCYDAAIIDVRLPGVTGVSLGALVREYDVNLPLAYLTSLDSPVVRREAEIQRALFLLKYDFVMEDGGLNRLLNIVMELAQLNPCIGGGVRLDNSGFPRHLEHTPIELSAGLSTLLNYSRSLARAA